MSRPFVLLFQGRTGSSLLKQSLDSHPKIHMLGEEPAGILLTDGVKRTGWAHRGRRKRVGRVQLEWIRAFFESPPSGGVLRHGFKTKLIDVLPRKDFATLLETSGCTVLHSTRRNLVKMAVSALNATEQHKRTGRYNRTESDPALPALQVSPAEFRAELAERVRREEDLARFVETLPIPVLKVEYEDLLLDLSGQLERICAFLEVPAASLQARDRKNTSDDLRLALANFDEVKAAFRDTRFETMFDEAGKGSES